jgi:hypothetical protein
VGYLSHVRSESVCRKVIHGIFVTCFVGLDAALRTCREFEESPGKIGLPVILQSDAAMASMAFRLFMLDSSIHSRRRIYLPEGGLEQGDPKNFRVIVSICLCYFLKHFSPNTLNGTVSSTTCK